MHAPQSRVLPAISRNRSTAQYRRCCAVRVIATLSLKEKQLQSMRADAGSARRVHCEIWNTFLNLITMFIGCKCFNLQPSMMISCSWKPFRRTNPTKMRINPSTWSLATSSITKISAQIELVRNVLTSILLHFCQFYSKFIYPDVSCKFPKPTASAGPQPIQH